MSQLPSSHLFIHRVPAKLFYGVFAPRSKLPPATALVCKLILTDPTRLSSGTDFFSGRYTIFSLLLVCVHDEALFRFTVIGFLSRTLPDLRIVIRKPGRGLEYRMQCPDYYAATGCRLVGILISFSIFSGSYLIPFFRIV